MSGLNEATAAPATCQTIGSMFGILLPGQPVRTDFQQTGDTTMELYVPNVNEFTNLIAFIIQAPPPPENLAYSVYLQQGKRNPIFLGQLTSEHPSISVGLTHLLQDREIESAGIIHISIEPTMPAQPDQFDDKEKLLVVGQRLVEDFFQYLSSFDDVPFQGEHYVPYDAVMNWVDAVPRRVKASQKFWEKVQ